MKTISKENYISTFCNNYIEKYENIPGFIPTSTPDENLRLINKYSEGHKSILEIGTWIGRSALGFSQNFKRVVTLDYFEGSDINYSYLGLEPGHLCKGIHNVELIKIDSKKFTTEERFDCVYIDGNHSYDGFLADFLISKHHCKNNGIIFIDDYFNETMGVQKAVNDTIYDKLINVSDTTLVFVLNEN